MGPVSLNSKMFLSLTKNQDLHFNFYNVILRYYLTLSFNFNFWFSNSYLSILEIAQKEDVAC